MREQDFWDAVMLALLDKGMPISMAIRGANEALAARKTLHA